MFNWLTKLLNKPYTDADAVEEVVVVEKEYHSLVGEPVISFLNSLKSNPKRYRVRRVSLHHLAGTVPGFKRYEWMHEGNTDLFTLNDRKTGAVYYARVSGADGKLQQVYGLPFNLNHYEHAAIKQEVVKLHAKGRQRLRSIENSRGERERLAKEAAELVKRLEFAGQFKD